MMLKIAGDVNRNENDRGDIFAQHSGDIFAQHSGGIS